ncbi:MAG: glycosyltransferase family 2 protein [Acidimicrobiia bacterium]
MHQPEVDELPLVSIIIPAYNVEAYIAQAVDSALAQTYPRVEVVVVNDGSTDGTAEIIAGYGDRIVAVNQENQGPGAARNSGLRAAHGSLIGLLDSDDIWLPERLDAVVPLLMDRPEIGMVTSNSYVMEGTTPTLKQCYGDRRRHPFPAREQDQLDEIAQRNFLFVSVVFRKNLVDRFGEFDAAMRFMRSEDYELWTRFLVNGARAAYVPAPLGYYRVRPGSLSASPEQWAAHLCVLERHLPELWKQGARGSARDAFEIGEKLAASGDRRGAFPFFSHAVRGRELSTATRIRLGGVAVRRLALGPRDSGSRFTRRG